VNDFQAQNIPVKGNCSAEVTGNSRYVMNVDHYLLISISVKLVWQSSHTKVYLAVFIVQIKIWSVQGLGGDVSLLIIGYRGFNS
jgi:hypothetical protein